MKREKAIMYYNGGDIDKYVGGRIKGLRELFNMSLQDLSKQTKIPIRDLKHCEAGENCITVEELYKITKALGISFGKWF